MKKAFILIYLLITVTSMVTAQTKVRLTVGDRSITATLVDNEATRVLTSLLEKSPISLSMNDYGGFEKVGALPQALPASNSQITTEAGDIMLYQGNNMVIFYGSNSWSYTRLGKIDAEYLTDLKEFLGSGNITLTVALNPASGIEDITVDDGKENRVYDLKGNLVTSRPLKPGIYIINGKKELIKTK